MNDKDKMVISEEGFFGGCTDPDKLLEITSTAGDTITFQTDNFMVPTEEIKFATAYSTERVCRKIKELGILSDDIISITYDCEAKQYVIFYRVWV